MCSLAKSIYIIKYLSEVHIFLNREEKILEKAKKKKKKFFWVMPEYSQEKENNNSGSVPAPELASLTLLLFAVKLPFLQLLYGGTVLSGDQFTMLCLCSLEETCGSGTSEGIYAQGQALVTQFDDIPDCNVKGSQVVL